MANSAINSKHNLRTEDLAPGVHIHFTRRMLILLAILLISPCLITAAVMLSSQVLRATNWSFAPRSKGSESGQISEGKPGPWGRLLYMNVMFDIPDEFVRIPADLPPTRWFFQDYTRDKVLEFLKSTDLSQSQMDLLSGDEAWQAEVNGAWLTPGDKFILGLSPAARLKIFSVLMAFPQNADRFDPEWFRAQTLDQQLGESGLSQSSIRLLKSLLYQSSPSLLLLLDKETALRQIADIGEKRRFIKAISRRATLMARLKIDAAADIEGLASYWGVGGRRKDILPLLSSLQRIEEGWNLSIVYLLPPFMRAHLYNYPFPSADTQAIKQDCFWTAFNAFNAQTDDRLSDMAYVRQELIKDYYSISQPSQLGDIVFVADADNQAMHAAVFVADDIVFTKNGFHFTQPWILMHLKDMVETYGVRYPPGKKLNVLYFRKKSL